MDEQGSIWNDVITKKISFLRVRVFQRPLSEYLRFEVEAYKIQAKKCEDFRIVSFDKLQEVGITDAHDFMLFDSKKALIPEFSKDNVLIRAVLSDDHKILQPFLQQREILLRISIPLQEFVRSEGI